MKKTPIIIDTDPGIDDFFCLALGLSYEDVFDLKAVTTMGGNNYTEVTTANAIDIVHLFKKEVPVAMGAESYLKEAFEEPVWQHHGHNGLADAQIPHCAGTPDPLRAWDKIAQVAEECAGELVLVTVAPLTNIALALQKYPQLPSQIRKIVMMGGSTEAGNITPYAEANIGHDAWAADIVFRSGIPVDMVGLNVTLKCPLPREIFDPISEKLDPVIRGTMQTMIDFRKGEPMHDAVAIASLIDEKILEFLPADVTVETENGERIGQTVVKENSGANTRVAVKADLPRYYNVIAGMCH